LEAGVVLGVGQIELGLMEARSGFDADVHQVLKLLWTLPGG